MTRRWTLANANLMVGIAYVKMERKIARNAWDYPVQLCEQKGIQTGFLVSECDKDELVGNGFCNDETNVQKCAFDGGDCCLEAIKVRDCKECICKTTGLKHRKKGVVESK